MASFPEAILRLMPLRCIPFALVGVVSVVYLNLFYMSWVSRNDAVFLTTWMNQSLPLLVRMDHAYDELDDEEEDDFVFDVEKFMNRKYEPILFERARPMALLRQNVSLQFVYKYPDRYFSGECSCLNPKATTECCSRTFRRCVARFRVWCTALPGAF